MDSERPIEMASRKVWVVASQELLDEMRKGWSRFVQVHAEPNADGSWEMTFRTVDMHGVNLATAL